MAQRSGRRPEENTLRDMTGHPVILLYDETNDKTIMARANSSGNLIIVGEVDATIKLDDGDGGTLDLSGSTQNNQNQLAINTDNVEGKLDDVLAELRILNFHLSNITDMQIDKEDIK